MQGFEKELGSCVKFQLGRQGFGLPLEQVREIVAAGAVTPVPQAPSVIRGLANLRGRVVTLIDVATVFNRPLPAARTAEDRLALLLGAPWEHLGVYVHAPVEIGQAVTAPAGVQRGPLTVSMMGVGGDPGDAGEPSDPARPPAVGLSTVSGDFVHMISAPELVAFCEARVLEGFRKRN